MLSSKAGSGTGKEANLKIMRMRLRRTVTLLVLPILLVLTIAVVLAPRGFAQSGAQADAAAKAAAAPGQTSSGLGSPDQSSADIVRELEAMKARIEQLEAELKRRAATVASATSATAAAAPVTAAAPVSVQTASETTAGVLAKPEKIAPFSDWDWTWLNGNPRNKDTAFDSKFFTPEIRADITYNYDFNKPVDDSIGGSSEIFRANEIQLEQLGIGGDFHYDNVRARFMTQFGMYSTATVRNDPSYSKGQWNVNDADRYLSEAYGGYHINALDGINIDAGIFMSYIGLFSYYNFDNWAYQPSYVSSNTPWFFEGLRVQIFPTPHLKIEPWLINGWQSYGSANSRKGVGGQIKWTPRPWVNIVSNNYGLGHDDLYIQNRGRIHTDDSIEIKYYDKPGQFLDKMAFTFTGDMGCEFGPSTATLAGVSCHGDKKDALAQPSVNFPRGESILNRALSAICCTTALGSKRTGSDSRSAAARSTIRDATWFWCRPSMVRRHLRRRLTPPTSRATPGIRSRPGIARSHSITCRSSGSRSAGSTTTAMRACHIGRVAEESRHRVRAGCLIPTTDLRNSSLATTGIRPCRERFPWRKRPAERKAAAYGFPIYARTSRCLTSTLW